MRHRVKISRRGRAEEPEIIVVPMIDVMMFLLFFFMVASLAMAVQNGIPVNLPKAASGQDSRAETVTITAKPDGTIYLDTAPITIDKLGAQLKTLGVDAKTQITLNVDEKVPYGTVVAVIDESRKVGALNFAFATNRN